MKISKNWMIAGLLVFNLIVYFMIYQQLFHPAPRYTPIPAEKAIPELLSMVQSNTSQAQLYRAVEFAQYQYVGSGKAVGNTSIRPESVVFLCTPKSRNCNMQNGRLEVSSNAITSQNSTVISVGACFNGQDSKYYIVVGDDAHYSWEYLKDTCNLNEK